MTMSAEEAVRAVWERRRLAAEVGAPIARDHSPYVSVCPAMRSGQPTINGTRLTVDAVVGLVWAQGVDVAAEDYELTRADVLVACWYAGSYGLPGQRQSLFPVRLWPKRWAAWAAGVHQALWSVSNVDYETIPDPPRIPSSSGMN